MKPEVRAALRSRRGKRAWGRSTRPIPAQVPCRDRRRRHHRLRLLRNLNGEDRRTEWSGEWNKICHNSFRSISRTNEVSRLVSSVSKTTYLQDLRILAFRFLRWESKPQTRLRQML